MKNIDLQCSCECKLFVYYDRRISRYQDPLPRQNYQKEKHPDAHCFQCGLEIYEKKQTHQRCEDFCSCLKSFERH